MSEYVTGGNVTPTIKSPAGAQVMMQGNRYVMPYASMALAAAMVTVLCFISFGVMLPALNRQAAWAQTQTTGAAAVRSVQTALAADVSPAQLMTHQGRYLKDLAKTATVQAGSCRTTAAGAYTVISRGSDNHFYVYTSTNGVFHWVVAPTAAAAITKACTP